MIHRHVFIILYYPASFYIPRASTYNRPGQICSCSEVDVFHSNSYKHFHYGGWPQQWRLLGPSSVHMAQKIAQAASLSKHHILDFV